MTGFDYEYLRRFLRERSGLVLSVDKHYLLESRLLPVARRAGLAGLAELVHRLLSNDCEALRPRWSKRSPPMNRSSSGTNSVRAFSRYHHSAAHCGAQPLPPDSHLVCCRLHRPGALFARPVD